MHGHDAAPAVAGRDRIEEVREIRAEPAQSSREAQCHAQLLAAGPELDGLHSLRDELRMPRHRGQALAVGEWRQLP